MLQKYKTHPTDNIPSHYEAFPYSSLSFLTLHRKYNTKKGQKQQYNRQSSPRSWSRAQRARKTALGSPHSLSTARNESNTEIRAIPPTKCLSNAKTRSTNQTERETKRVRLNIPATLLTGERKSSLPASRRGFPASRKRCKRERKRKGNSIWKSWSTGF